MPSAARKRTRSRASASASPRPRLCNGGTDLVAQAFLPVQAAGAQARMPVPPEEASHCVLGRSIRQVRQVIFVALLGGELGGHRLLLLRRQGVDLLLLIAQLLEVNLIHVGFARRVRQVLANAILIGVEA